MLKKVITNLIYVLDCTLNLVYSDGDKCCICDNYCEDTSFLCNSCYSKIRFCTEKYYIKEKIREIECYSMAYYSSVIKEMIVNLKYKSDFKSGKALAEMMQGIIYEKNIKFDYITFVPMTKKYLKIRGYNQSEFLAQYISRHTDVKMLELLKKNKDSKDQIGLDSDERWYNIRGCFEFIGNKNDIKEKNILLIDDVITTGATAFYCAEKLINNNANNVIVLTAAKSKI
ncbi:ComF family protein [Clostridium tepidiprofundi]|nr:ComF family protein [Clostridium tepidiprofundi]